MLPEHEGGLGGEGRSRESAPLQQALRSGAAGLPVAEVGVHISVAVAWQRASGGDWMGDAAEVAARSAIRIGSRAKDTTDAR